MITNNDPLVTVVVNNNNTIIGAQQNSIQKNGDDNMDMTTDSNALTTSIIRQGHISSFHQQRLVSSCTICCPSLTPLVSQQKMGNSEMSASNRRDMKDNNNNNNNDDEGERDNYEMNTGTHSSPPPSRIRKSKLIPATATKVARMTRALFGSPKKLLTNKDTAIGDATNYSTQQVNEVETSSSSDGEGIPVFVPFTHPIFQSRRIVDICCGANFSLICLDDCTVWGFGLNSRSQMSTCKDTEQNLQKIPGLDGLGVIKVRAKGEHALFITKHGTVYSCGSNDWNNCGYQGVSNIPREVIFPGKDVFITDVQSGYGHVLALDAFKGIAYSFGGKSFLQLGRTDYKNLIGVAQLPDYVRVVQVVAGGAHSIFICEHRITGDQLVYMCGKNNLGSLANGHYEHTQGPELLNTSQFDPYFKKCFLSIEAGQNHTAFITDTGDLFLCGDNMEGQCVFNSTQKCFCKVQHLNPIIPNLYGQPIMHVACAYNATIFCTEGCANCWIAGRKWFSTGNEKHSLQHIEVARRLHQVDTTYLKFNPSKQTMRIVAGEIPLLFLIDDQNTTIERSFPKLQSVARQSRFQDVTIIAHDPVSDQMYNRQYTLSL